MVPLSALWLPILVSAVIIFVASNILWMLLPFWHARDYKRLSEQIWMGTCLRADLDGDMSSDFASPD